MALLDRAATGFSRVVLDTSVAGGTAEFRDYCGRVTPVATNTVKIDPVVSGTTYSHFLTPAGSSSISIPIDDLSTLDSVHFEFYLYFGGAVTNVLAYSGGNPLITFDPTGFLRFDLPFASSPVVRIDYLPEATSQIAMSLTNDSYLISVDGVERAAGNIDWSQFRDDATITMASQASTSVLVFGAFLMSSETQGSSDIQARALEAFFFSPDSAAMFDVAQYEFSDTNQDFATKLDVPESLRWSEFATQGLRERDGQMQLDLFYPERYDEDTKSYIIDDIARYCNSSQGMLHVRIPSYVTSGSPRGVIRLRNPDPGYDQHEIRFNSSNRVEYVYTQFSVDGFGIDNSTVTTTVLPTPSGSISGGASVRIGFGWNSTGLYVVYNSTAWQVPNVGIFSIYGYQAMFGNGRVSPAGAFDAPAFASQATWNWFIKIFGTFNEASPQFDLTAYGLHTFDTSLALIEDLPIFAETSFSIPVTVTDAEYTREPYVYIEGSPAASVGVSEVIE